MVAGPDHQTRHRPFPILVNARGQRCVNRDENKAKDGEDGKANPQGSASAHPTSPRRFACRNHPRATLRTHPGAGGWELPVKPVLPHFRPPYAPPKTPLHQFFSVQMLRHFGGQPLRRSAQSVGLAESRVGGRRRHGGSIRRRPRRGCLVGDVLPAPPVVYVRFTISGKSAEGHSAGQKALCPRAIRQGRRAKCEFPPGGAGRRPRG